MQIALLGCEDEEQELRDLSGKPWENGTDQYYYQSLSFGF